MAKKKKVIKPKRNPDKPRKSLVRSAKNVIKCLVKESQRMNLYKSEYHVKFWNSILKQAKLRTKSGAIKNDLVLSIIEHRDESFKNRLLEETDVEKIKVLERKREILKPFIERNYTSLVNNDTARTNKEMCMKYNIFTEEEYKNLPVKKVKENTYVPKKNRPKEVKNNE